MNIVFVGFSTSYTPGMTYQDNMLCQQALADGHQVTFISNPEKFVNGKIVETGPEDTVLPDGLRLIRLPYHKLGTAILTKKLRKFDGVYPILESLHPNVLYCHNHHYWSILDVIRYKKAHPEVKLYADTHVAADNSGTNWLSLHILHRIYYRYLIQRALPYLEKYFYIRTDEKRFAMENYGVPEKLMEFYPLGGTLPTEAEYASARKERRAELGVQPDELLLVHAGKLEPKKKTELLLHAFAAVPELKARLAIIGSIPEEDKPRLLPLMEADKRVAYLGWKDGTELQEYLCACDLYVQPGKVSAILQNALCCGCPCLSYPHESYQSDYSMGGFLWSKDEAELTAVFRQLAAGEIDLTALRQRSERCARELLDYRALAARIYQ